MGEEGGLAAQLGEAAGLVGGGTVGALLPGLGGGLVPGLGGQRSLGAARQAGLLARLPQGSPGAGGQRQAEGQGQQAPVSTQKRQQKQGHARRAKGERAREATAIFLPDYSP